LFADLKMIRTFAPLSTESTLENRCTARYPGFESLSLRNKR